MTRALIAQAERIHAAVQILPHDDVASCGSPFATAREQILASVRLSMLVAHLYNKHWPCDLPGLFAEEQEPIRDIALQLIESYAVLGDTDPDFMSLGFELAQAIATANPAPAPIHREEPEIDEDDGYRFG